MGGAPKYSKGRQNLKRMSDAARHRKEGNLVVDEGRGIYPQCLKTKPLGEMCPKEVSEDPLNVPKECKLCLEFMESDFYHEKYMTKERRAERFKAMGIPLRIEM